MLDRRRFLKTTGFTALGTALLSSQSSAFFDHANAMRPAGLQLYTLFSVFDDDVNGYLQKISSVGYKEIESAFSKKGGYYGLKSKEFSKLLSDNGLTWKSHHVTGAPFKLPPGAKPPVGADGKPITIPKMRNLSENMQELVDEAAEGGVPYLVCSSIPLSTGEEIKKALEVLQKAGEACKKAGLQFAYHNHEAEYKTVDGIVPYDEMLKQINSDILKMELDLAWATKAGKDPVEIFKAHPGRYPLWHVKDLNKESGRPVEVGAGYIDFKRIFDNASIAGMKHFFVEQDGAPKPVENITASFNSLKKLLG